jgi:phospholipase C
MATAGLLSQAPEANTAAAVTVTSKIKHVVIIYQENHTFDSLLGAVCKQRTVPCNSYLGPVTLANGTTVQNRQMPQPVPEVAHSVGSQRAGMANRWNEIKGCAPATNYACITHAVPSQIPNLARLANRYAVSDATFASGGVSSFTAHVEIASGTTAGFQGMNPLPSKTGAPPRPGWGCPSNLDTLWGVGFQSVLTWEPSCIPLRDGTGAYRPTRVPYARTIMEQLESNGLTWHMYVGVPGKPSSGFIWNFCSYFAWCNGHGSGKTSAYSTFSTDAANGTLPNLSFIPATSKWSQHNGTSLTEGDNYMGSLINAVMNGPDSASTAIFITYDDCGCFYDHVKPPPGRGLRNPMVIVSPWAKQTWTDSKVAEQPYSMLAFIDNNFGLPALTPRVGAAYDYSNSFDFTRTATTPAPRMVHTHISPHLRAQVRKNADMWEDDPT